MTETCSTQCGRPSPDACLCRGCTNRLEQILAEMPSMLHDLDVQTAGQGNMTSSRFQPGSKSTKKSEHALPYDTHASELASKVRNALSTTIRHLCEYRGIPTPASLPGSEAMARWLLRNLDAIRQDEAAGDIYAGMVDIAMSLRSAVDNREKRYAGPCTARVLVGEVVLSGEVIQVAPVERDCGADLRVRANVEKIICGTCGKEYSALERMQWIVDRSAEHMALISFIDAALCDAGYIRKDTARKWLERDRKRPKKDQEFFAWAEDDEGRPLYRLGDFLDRAKRVRDGKMAV